MAAAWLADPTGRHERRRGVVVAAVVAALVVGGAVAGGGSSPSDSTDDELAATNDDEQPEVTTTVEAASAPTTDAPTTAAPPSTAAPAPAAPTPASAGGTFGVRWITDGDTFVLSDGRRVRLAQVDAPETNECFGSESTAALRTLIDGREVTLRRPPTGPETDRYGRTLADVQVAGRSVNEALVATGAAEWYEEFADEDADLARRLESAESAARRTRLGLWSACSTTPPPAPPVTQALVTPTTAATAPSGGNCHPAYPDDCIPPAPPDLDCGDVKRKVRVDHAHGDPHGFDANDDGWGCESYG